MESVLQLYGSFGIEETLKQLDAEYAFCLIDSKTKKVYVARDPYGVRPLFYLSSKSGILGVSSESKGIYSNPEGGLGTKMSPFITFFTVFLNRICRNL